MESVKFLFHFVNENVESFTSFYFYFSITTMEFFLQIEWKIQYNAKQFHE